MTDDLRALGDAVLHEGYLLYPYRPSSLKNLHRYPFGTLYPEPFCRAHEAGDVWFARLECVIIGPTDARVAVQLRFLHLEETGAVVREIDLPGRSIRELAAGTRTAGFACSALSGELAVRAVAAAPRHWKLSVEIRNTTALGDAAKTSRDDALKLAFSSTHLVLRSLGGEFVSAIDPPASAADMVESCKSVGLWPVLVGRPGTRDALLAAPIILYDYPELAPESPADFFDGTEIDELLILRILTLTEQEKRAMAEGDARGRALLERIETVGLARTGELHGRLQLRRLLPGARVRLRPKGRADIFDIALDGKAATVHSVERDLDGRTHVVVTVDDDPGKDFGPYGHRFFFKPEEVELL